METKSIRIPLFACGSQPDILEVLTGGPSNSEPIFESMADALAFASAIGQQINSCPPQGDFTFRSGDPIRFQIFENRGYKVLFDVLAVCHSGDSAILNSDEASADLRGDIFERYAAGGLAYLAQELSGQTDPLSALILIAQSVHSLNSGAAQPPQ